MRFPFVAAVLFALLGPALPAYASDDEAPSLTDCDNCRDHALLARYPGSVLVGADQVAFDEIALPVGPATTDPDSDEAIALKTLKLSGKRTRLFYFLPPERSTLEVFANYRQALDQAGMTTLWTCAGTQECGKNFDTQAIEAMDLNLANTTNARIGFSDSEKPRYLVAELKRPQGDLHIALLAADFSTRGHGGLYVLILEGKPMDQGLIKLDAAALERDLLRGGKATIYGIRFDFDKAEIKPESKPQLDEIARLLTQQPNLKLRISGHTDNQGSDAYNRDLSQRRAQAIVAALVGSYRIDAARLSAAGLGASAPVADNDSEEGRARNRRVELARQE